MSKKKNYDQKIEEYTEKLKMVQKQKKEFIEKKGRQLWTKIKVPFMEKEKAIENLLVDKDKLNILVEGIKKILDTTNVNEIKNEKEEKKDTRQSNEG